jgi:hypothetical protein
MSADRDLWGAADYFVPLADPGAIVSQPVMLTALAAAMLDRVARANTSAPGFALIDAGDRLDPVGFRSLLVELAGGLDHAYRERFPGRRLALHWVGRFSQQRTTEPHLDGAPEDSLLMLGYEPSPVVSHVAVHDYSRAALDRGLEPGEFLNQFNPTFGESRALMEPYRTRLHRFDGTRYQVLLVNNSSGPFVRRRDGMIGVMHQSMIPAPDPASHRFVSTLMMTTADESSPDRFRTEDVELFVRSGEFKAA